MAGNKYLGTVLVADDEREIQDILTNLLTDEGFDVDTADDGEQAIAMIDGRQYDIVITDLQMPGVDGIGVLSHLASSSHNALGIVVTAFGTIETAVEALRLGAFDYITKPFHLGELRQLVRKAREYQLELQATPQVAAKPEPREPFKVKDIIGESAQMHELADMIRTVADSDSTVLILGESGTGKELVARAIHSNSPRSSAPLIPVNCGAIPEELLESELFGHVKGAFTGASADRVGRFQLAEGGTIFLDEIGDMSPKLQVKILRVLQEKTLEPVGSTQTHHCDVRVLAATHRNLEQRVREGKFREDLFYRLNVIPIEVPPLRLRLDDIPLLVSFFVEKFNRSKGRQFQGFSGEAMATLMNYTWPGNVRELENLVERMTILHKEGEAAPEHLPGKFVRTPAIATNGTEPAVPSGPTLFEIPEEGIDFNALVGDYETMLIRKALEKADGVKNKAAALLQIKRTTLVEKMKKKGMLD